MAGKILRIHVKNKTKDGIGIPKTPIMDVFVRTMGLEGDYNNYRMKKRNGTFDHAVLLLSKEIYDTLNSEGWPAKPGDLGENFYIQDWKYDEIIAGDRFKLGNSVIIQISEKCKPCSVLANLPYIGQEKINQFIKTLLNRRGWYARVLTEGKVKVGDKFIPHGDS